MGGSVGALGNIIKTGIAKVGPLVGAALLGDILDPSQILTQGQRANGIPQPYSPGINGVPLVGPGLPEPPAWMVAKEWHIRGGKDGRVTAQMYLLIDGRIASYNKGKKTWKVWRPKKNIVLSSNPRCNDLIKADKKIDSLMKRLAKRAGLVKRSTRSRRRIGVPTGTSIINVD